VQKEAFKFFIDKNLIFYPENKVTISYKKGLIFQTAFTES